MIEFEKIPKLYYVIDVRLDHIPEHLERWERNQISGGFSFERTPDFQRGHVWTEEQQIAFVEWVLRGGTTTPIIFNHERWMSDYKADMVCIDGLQRITAIEAFLSGWIPAFGAYVDEFDKSQIMGITLKFGVSTLDRIGYLNMYVLLNSGGTVHTAEEIERVKVMIEELQ